MRQDSGDRGSSFVILPLWMWLVFGVFLLPLVFFWTLGKALWGIAAWFGARFLDARYRHRLRNPRYERPGEGSWSAQDRSKREQWAREDAAKREQLRRILPATAEYQDKQRAERKRPGSRKPPR